jgi:RNA-directed DNA polymerase
MHYAFDRWMDREFPGSPFERYADDVLTHCGSEEQARHLRAAVAERLGALGLELHPLKTKIAYCKDANRRGNYEHTTLDFLGYTFRGRLALGPRSYFNGFSPAMSNSARRAVGQKIRAWHLNRRSGSDLHGRGEEISPQVRGWVNYYGAFYRSELRFLAWRINEHLVRRAMQKLKRFRRKCAKATQWLVQVYLHQPALFAHWQLAAFAASQTLGAR